jgi:hypothetical protein
MAIRPIMRFSALISAKKNPPLEKRRVLFFAPGEGVVARKPA